MSAYLKKWINRSADYIRRKEVLEKTAVVRVDKRTRTVNRQIVEEIENATTIKYLGIHIDDDLSFRTEANNLRDQVSALKKKLKRAYTFLPGQVYIVWKTLTESTIHHKLVVIAAHSPKATQTCKQIYYQLLLDVFNLHHNTSAHRLLELTIGDVTTYLKKKLHCILAGKQCTQYETIEAREHIQQVN
jgi:hypothetical protein